MKIGKWFIGAGLAIGLLGVSSVVRGDYLVTLPSGSTNGGEPVNATANFHFTTNSLTLTLTNLVANPNAAGSLLGGISFTMQPVPVPGTTSITSASGTLINIGSGGVVSAYGGSVSDELHHWKFTSTPNPETFQVAGGDGPGTGNDPLIIGDPGSGGTYSNANSSITGSEHQPLLQKTGTFVFTILGVTSATKVNTASFLFGTTFSAIEGDVTTVNQITPVPAPSAFAGGLIVFGILAGRTVLRRRSN